MVSKEEIVAWKINLWWFDLWPHFGATVKKLLINLMAYH